MNNYPKIIHVALSYLELCDDLLCDNAQTSETLHSVEFLLLFGGKLEHLLFLACTMYSGP